MVEHFVIPHFVRDALKRRGLPLGTILDFNKVREVLSINDIVLVQTLQKSEVWKKLLGIDHQDVKNFHYGTDMSLYGTWYDSASVENREYLVKILSVLVESGQANDEIAERLFSNNRGVQAQEPVTSYEITDIGPKYYGIIIESGVFPNRTLSNKLLKDILKSMYLYHSQSEIAGLELFRLYMGRL